MAGGTTKQLSDSARAALKALFDHGVRVAIVNTPNGARTLVGGNSYPIRETLKRLGFVYVGGPEPKWSAPGVADLDTLLPALLSAYYAHEDASAQSRPLAANSAAMIDRLFPRAVAS